MQSAQTQAEPQAAHSLHHTAAAVAGEEVPGEAIPEHRGAGRVLVIAASHRDTGENLVSKSSRQGQAAAGGGNREDQNGRIGARGAGCTVGHGRLLSSESDASGISGGQVGVR